MKFKCPSCSRTFRASTVPFCGRQVARCKCGGMVDAADAVPARHPVKWIAGALSWPFRGTKKSWHQIAQVSKDRIITTDGASMTTMSAGNFEAGDDVLLSIPAPSPIRRALSWPFRAAWGVVAWPWRRGKPATFTSPPNWTIRPQGAEYKGGPGGELVMSAGSGSGVEPHGRVSIGTSNTDGLDLSASSGPGACTLCGAVIRWTDKGYYMSSKGECLCPACLRKYPFGIKTESTCGTAEDLIGRDIKTVMAFMESESEKKPEPESDGAITWDILERFAADITKRKATFWGAPVQTREDAKRVLMDIVASNPAEGIRRAAKRAGFDVDDPAFDEWVKYCNEKVYEDKPAPIVPGWYKCTDCGELKKVGIGETWLHDCPIACGGHVQAFAPAGYKGAFLWNGAVCSQETVKAAMQFLRDNPCKATFTADEPAPWTPKVGEWVWCEEGQSPVLVYSVEDGFVTASGSTISLVDGLNRFRPLTLAEVQTEEQARQFYGRKVKFENVKHTIKGWYLLGHPYWRIGDEDDSTCDHEIRTDLLTLLPDSPEQVEGIS